MKIHLSLARRELKSPLTRAELGQATRIFAQHMRKEPVWLAFVERFGGRPQAVSLRIVDDAEMRDIYQNFKGRRKTTDVLSFPSIEVDGLDFHDEERSLGDIVISLPAVERGARRGRRTLRQEFLEVFLHSLLHLLGLDHVLGKKVRARDALYMRKMQARLFARAKDFIKP